MMSIQYPNLLLEQTKDLIWLVDHHLNLVYANKAYLALMKEVTGYEKELNTPILMEGFGEGYIEKWKAYYEKAFSGKDFEIEEHFFNPTTGETQFGYITFYPIKNEQGITVNVA
ncbi:MAG: PAS domain-containing protein, partial [Chitinophagaceae bacterium]|nr:PAS domain-containing protein [Chitinophagaceae bacterium]